MSESATATPSYLRYPLQNGFVHHWLVAGPYALPIEVLGQFVGDDFKEQIAATQPLTTLPFTESPVEMASFAVNDVRGEHLQRWQSVRCEIDHYVNLTAFYPTCHYLVAWACTEVERADAGSDEWLLATNGPAAVWVNGELVHQQTAFSLQVPYRQRFHVDLNAGHNQVIVAFANVAARACPFVMALQVGDTAANLAVQLPTHMPLLQRRQKLEAIFAAAYLERSTYHREDLLKLKWPKDLSLSGALTVRLQTPSGRIYAEAKPTLRAGGEVNFGQVYQVPEGAYQIVLMPTLEEYHEHGLRIQRRIDLRITSAKYAETPVDTFEQRRQAALDNAARRNLNIFSEIAKMALGRWGQVKPAAIEAAIASINQRADCSDFYLIGLLGMLYRFGEEPEFPAAIKPALEACILNFKYWIDEPGDDAMCYWTENHQILFHACEILAGQLFPERIFTNNGQTGAWHRAKGEERALSWLRKRMAGGFQEWDSNCYFEEDVLALSHLIDLAATDEIAELAAIVLDKLCFTLAVNSFKGVFGSTHGRTYARLIKGGRSESTSPIARLLWGLGVFNEHLRGVVGLACAQSYELPPILEKIATARSEELWSRERHAGQFEFWADRKTGDWAVDKVTYKTPDYMLCSAQSYAPGEPGVQQHIWQATFGVDAVVFVNHPHCVSEDNAHRPNWWAGNVVLPRVAQWKDVLVAVHQLPEDDWLGFTHAYFPTWAFDEWTLRDGWLFARKGEGYLALIAAGGLTPVWRGPDHFEEVRSPGSHNVWFVQLGRAAADGDFAEFQRSVLALDLTFDDLAVHTITLRGETIDFGWQGPLLVNEREQPLSNFRHYDNPFCQMDLAAPHMEIQFLDQVMRLDLSPRSDAPR